MSYYNRDRAMATPPYLLTAYGIAQRHGYTGTEEEWLASLVGDPGEAVDLRFDAETKYIQYKHGSDTEWTDLVSMEDLMTQDEAAVLAAMEEIKDAVETAVETAGGHSEDAEAWAVGKRGGIDVEETDETYHNNAKYYAGEAAGSATAAAASVTSAANQSHNASVFASNAASASSSALNSALSASSSASSASGSALSAQNSATAAAESAVSAGESASSAAAALSDAESIMTLAQTAANSAYSDAERAHNWEQEAERQAALAAGAAQGAASDVAQALEQYADRAETAAQTATTQAGAASDSATAAAASVSDAEAFGAGTRNGTDVTSGDDAYQNNAKYYSEQAAASAATLTLDTTLTSTTQAPQSKVVGENIADLKSAITYTDTSIGATLNFTPLQPTGQGWIPTKKDVGEVVNLTDIRSADGRFYWVISCSENDVFTINASSCDTSHRGWVFTKSDGEVVATSGTTASFSNVVITAPANTAYLVCNDYGAHPHYIGAYTDIGNRLGAVETKTASNSNTIANSITVSSAGTNAYNFIAGKTYEIINNSAGQVSVRTRMGASYTNIETVSVNANSTKLWTCGSNADGVNIYLASGTMDVTIHQTDSYDYLIATNTANINTVSTKLDNTDLSLKQTLNVTTAGPIPYKFVAGQSYFVENNSDGQISFRTRIGYTDIERFYLSAGYSTVFNCTQNADAVDIYLASGNIDVMIQKIDTFDFRIKTNSARIDKLDPTVIPSYFDTMMAAKIPAIRDNMNAAGQNGDTFVFITDIHWQNNAKNSLALIRYIINKTNINKIICGGDIIGQGERDAMMDDMITAIKGMEFPFHNDLLVTFGNHDSNILSTVENAHFDLDTCYALMEKEAESYITMMTDSDLSFYYDDRANKTRYIVLDTGEDSGSSGRVFEAFDEFADAMLDTPEGWNIIVVAHIVTYGRFVAYISGMMDAYNAKTTYTDSTAGTFDFSTAKGKVICAFGGHTHVDSNTTTSGGIPIIVTTTDSYRVGETDPYPYVEGTDQEQAFDVVTIDYTAKTIKCVRIGRGIDRTINYQ